MTLHLKTKVTLLLAGNPGKASPLAVSKLGQAAAAGQLAGIGNVLARQLKTVQLNPCPGTSLTVAPSAAVAPELMNVTVYEVVPPACTALTASVLVTSRTVEQPVVKEVVAAVSTDTVPLVANHGETGVTVGVSTPLGPPVAVTDGTPAPLL